MHDARFLCTVPNVGVCARLPHGVQYACEASGVFLAWCATSPSARSLVRMTALKDCMATAATAWQLPRLHALPALSTLLCAT